MAKADAARTKGVASDKVDDCISLICKTLGSVNVSHAVCTARDSATAWVNLTELANKSDVLGFELVSKSDAKGSADPIMLHDPWARTSPPGKEVVQIKKEDD